MQNTFSDCAGERVEAVGSRVSEVSLFTMLVAEGVLGEWSTGVRVHLLWNCTATVPGGVQGETHTAGLHLLLHGEERFLRLFFESLILILQGSDPVDEIGDLRAILT